MIHVGIDPGLSGAVAILKEDGKLEIYDIPLIAKGVPDLRGLADIFKKISEQEHFVVMEDVHAIPGAGAMQCFNFGAIVGAKRALLEAFHLRYARVAPKTWQKQMWVGVENLKKPDGKNDTKAMSLVAATRLFPNETFLKSKDGRVDAALIALYAKFTFGGNN